MSFFDTGVGRKPPLPSSQLPQPTSYGDYNNNNEYLTGNPLGSLPPTNEVVIVHLIPNNNNTVAQIACIILSNDLQERESFSFNYTAHESFAPHADYIYSSLNNRIWIVTDEYPVPQLLDHSFKALNKTPPQAQRLINATEIFNNYKVFKSQSMTASCNARFGCHDTYATLQRIALNNLLSPTSNVPTQTIQSMERSHEYAPSNEAQDAPLTDNNPSNEWVRSATSTNNDILNEIIANEMNRDNNNEQYHDNTQFNMNQDTREALEEQVAQVVMDDAPTNDAPQAQAQDTPSNAYDDVNSTDNKSLNGFHDDPQHQADPMDNDPQEQDAQEQVQEEDYLQEIDEQVTSQTEEEQRSVHSSHGHGVSMSSSPASQQEAQKAIQQAPQAAGSWANLAKFKTKTSSSPKRRALGVVYQRGGGYAATKSLDGIRNSIDAAIKKKDIIWVSYNGHQKPFIPRAIRPMKWDMKQNSKESSFFAIQHKSKSQTKQRFYLKNVLEVRDKQWRISNVELDQLKKRNASSYSNYKQNPNDSNYTRRGYGGPNKNFQNKRPRPYNSSRSESK
eukprot:508826_1